MAKIQQKYKLLDLFCGGGGCCKGYQEAGFIVTGIDNVNHKHNYPGKFILADALEYVVKHGHKYDVIHASPPCQDDSKSTSPYKKRGYIYTNVTQQVRELITATGKLGVIEGVNTKSLRGDIILRGDQFNYKVLRKRYFELINWWYMNCIIPQKIGSVKNGDYSTVCGKGNNTTNRGNVQPKHKKGNVKETWGFAMGIDWMDEKQLSQAIPPAYTRYIGELLINHLNNIQ